MDKRVKPAREAVYTLSINKVIISGNLTRDPELKLTQGGTPVLSLGIAVNDRRKNPQTGEWEDVPNFVECVMFGNRAQAVSRFLSKGLKVAIEGKLRYSSWERDGQRRSKLEVMIDEIEFMSARNPQAVSQQGQGAYQPGFQPAQPDSYYMSQPAPATSPVAGENDAVYQQDQAVQSQGFSTQIPSAAPPSADVYDQDIPF